MSKWVKINPNWKFRLTIEGFEFIAYDENVNISILNLSQKRQDEIIAIIRGSKSFNVDRHDANLDQIIDALRKKNIISLSHIHKNPYKIKKKEILLQKIRKKVVGESGIIKRVYFLDPLRSGYHPKKSTLFSTKYISKTGYRNKKMTEWTSGISNDPIVSELKAIMEGIERFYSGEVKLGGLKRNTKGKIEGAIHPEKIISYLNNQYRSDLSIEPYSSKKKYLWQEGKEISSGKNIFLPIDLIYYPIDKKDAPHLLTFGNSNGIAAGFSYDDALTRGLYEVIERDAFMITWLNRLSLNKFVIESLPLSIRKRINKIQTLCLNVHIVNITMDTVPVVLAVAETSKNKPVILLGAASGFDIIECISKALSEIEQGVYWEYRDDSKIIKITNPKKVLKVKEHVSLFRNIKYYKEAEFLWKGKCISLDEKLKKKKKSDMLIKTLLEKDEKIFVIDMSPGVLKEIGVVVVRSYIPGFVPLSFGYGLEPLGMDRINDIPIKLGMKVNPWGEFPPLPHPFP